MRILDTPLQSYTLHISSRDCIYSDGFYTFNMNDPIISSYGYDMVVYCSNFEAPFTMYNININNNVLTYQENLILNTLTIPPGNYNPASLKNYLQSQMPNWQFIFSSVYGKFTFKTTQPNSALLGGLSTIRDIIGIAETTIPLTNYSAPYYSVQSQYVCNFTYTTCFFLISDLAGLASYDTISNNKSNILCKIPIDCNFGEVIFFSAVQSPNKLLYTAKTIQQLCFAITDDRKRFIDLNGPNNYFEFTISIDFIEALTGIVDSNSLGQSSAQLREQPL